MTHYRHWSATFATYFSIMGLWTAFGPSAIMASDPVAAPLALAAITLGYFVATPFARQLWNWLGFAATIRLLAAAVFICLALAAVAPGWMAWSVSLAFFFGSGAYTVCETRLLEDLARSGQGHQFGRSRKWGSFGFLAAAALGGALFSATSLGHSFALTLVLCAAAFLACCLALAAVSAPAADSTGLPGPATLSAQPTPPHPAALQTAQSSAGHKRAGSTAIAATRLADTIATTWFGAYWLATGHSPLQTGLLCALPVAAEFVAMWKGAVLLARFSPARLMLVCCAASAARWLATPYCTHLWCAIPLQSLHALSFGLFYPASLLWLKHAWGDAFFQRRYATESGARAVAALVSWVAAQWAIQALGYQSLYLLSAALALLSALWWAGARKPASTQGPTGLP